MPCPDQVASDAQLVVSELTTNAVMHAQSAPTVIATFDDGRLRIEVHDHDPRPPQLGDRPGADGGWGLRIVAAAADGWGWTPHTIGQTGMGGPSLLTARRDVSPVRRCRPVGRRPAAR